MENQLRIPPVQPLFFPKGESLCFNYQLTENTEQKPTEDSNLSNTSKKIHKKREKYQKIDDSVRQKLIEAVVKEGQMLKTAAKMYKINYSSAKSIFHTYRKEGRINKKSLRDRYIKQYSNMKDILPSRSISQTSSDSSPKSQTIMQQIPQFPFQNTNHLMFNQEATFIPQLKLHQPESNPISPRMALCESFSSKVNNSGYQNNYPTIQSLASFNQDLAQKIADQASNLKLCEELTRLQNMISSTLSMIVEKNKTETPIPAYLPILGLQEQIPNNSFIRPIDHKNLYFADNKKYQVLGKDFLMHGTK